MVPPRPSGNSQDFQQVKQRRKGRQIPDPFFTLLPHPVPHFMSVQYFMSAPQNAF